MKASTRKLLSLFLALTMLLSLTVLPVSAAPATAMGKATLTLDKTTLSLSERGETFTAILTVDTAGSNRASSGWAAWAKTLDWSLSRTAQSSPMDPALYPHVYTGDKLENWKTWGTDGTDGVPYFNIDAVTTALTGGNALVMLTFTTNTFYTDKAGANVMQILGADPDPARNMHGSFIGPYSLSVAEGGTILAATPLSVNIFESYTPYSALKGELVALKALAEKKGRYFEIVENGTTVDGNIQYLTVLSDSKASVDAYKKMNEIAIKNPAALQAKIKAGTMGNYRVPFFMNNVHPDECSATDTSLALLRDLATQDTLSYNTLTGLTGGKRVDKTMFDPKVAAIPGFTGLGSRKLSGSAADGMNDGKTDASAYYTIGGDVTIQVKDLLGSLIFVCCPVENPDGRSYNLRQNANGFDLNRDASNQNQPETTSLMKAVSAWNPVVFTEFHGYMAEFLVEPCTPPHEPNMEYDLLVNNFLLGAEAFGSAALGTMSRQNKYDTKFQTYYTPLRDDYDSKNGWSAWDDLSTNYGPSYAMLNCGAMGYTLELPADTEASMRLFQSGTIGLWDFVMKNKDNIYTKQLEFFRRGTENIDARAQMEPWYVDHLNKELPANTWRRPYSETNNFFPEYWVIPTGRTQRDPADAYEMARFLLRNGVAVETLTKDVTLGTDTYHAGDLLVPMYQAKRNYANAVLWQGADASNSGFPDLYSESVANFPAMRGFDCLAVTTKNAFKGSTAALTDTVGKSLFEGVTGKAVVLSNNGQETVRAVNTLLARGKAVGLITAGADRGNFILSHADYLTVSEQFILVATGTDKMPLAYQIDEPTVFLTGRYDQKTAGAVTTGYYAPWFKDGYGVANYENLSENNTSNYDLMAFKNHMGFKITEDPAEADVIFGSVSLYSGSYGEAAVKAVCLGTPYISSGTRPLDFIRSLLLGGNGYDTGKKDADGIPIYDYKYFDYTSLGMESLHRVTYPTPSLSTASYATAGDQVLYTYDCGVITTVPTGASILIQAASNDSHIAGCCLTEDGKALDGRVEAIAFTEAGMDLTIFANSLVNRAHQQDDYRYAANTVYSKCLAATPMSVAGLAPAMAFTDIGGHWAEDSIRFVAGKGLFVGTTGTTFSPALRADRGALWTVLCRMSGQKAPTAPAGAAWYVGPQQWAMAAGISDGLNPTAFISREQLATLLHNYAVAMSIDVKNGPVAPTPLSAYHDRAAISTWAVAGVEWAVAKGLISGKDSTTLDPQGFATRAEIATILQRFAEQTAQ